jgi:hypothetical protein
LLKTKVCFVKRIEEDFFFYFRNGCLHIDFLEHNGHKVNTMDTMILIQ